jgi:NTE family protein
MHRIAADEELTELGASSKLNNDLEFLQHLRMIGRTAAERWLADHRDSLGKRSSLDLESLVSGTRREKNRARKTA